MPPPITTPTTTSPNKSIPISLDFNDAARDVQRIAQAKIAELTGPVSDELRGLVERISADALVLAVRVANGTPPADLEKERKHITAQIKSVAAAAEAHVRLAIWDAVSEVLLRGAQFALGAMRIG